MPGRVSNTGTRNTTTVPLDRTITLAANTNYFLTIITSEPGCYVTDTTEASYTGHTIQGHANNLDTLSGGLMENILIYQLQEEKVLI